MTRNSNLQLCCRKNVDVRQTLTWKQSVPTSHKLYRTWVWWTRTKKKLYRFSVQNLETIVWKKKEEEKRKKRKGKRKRLLVCWFTIVNQTHTNRYVQFTLSSHHPESMKSGVIDCLVKIAATVSSNDELWGKEPDKIREAMNQNNYPKHFVEKVTEKGLRQRRMPRLVEQELDQGETTAKIPFIDGLNQEVWRIARTAGIRCAFFAPSTRPLYCVKDKLPRDLTTNAIYSIKCKTCDEKYVSEIKLHLRALQLRAKEHRDAIRLGNTEKSAIKRSMFTSRMSRMKLTGIQCQWSTEPKLGGNGSCERRLKSIKGSQKMNRDASAGLEHSKTWHSIL